MVVGTEAVQDSTDRVKVKDVTEEAIKVTQNGVRSERDSPFFETLSKVSLTIPLYVRYPIEQIG